MQHFIFNLTDGDRETARALLHARRWRVGRDERHREALGPGDLVLIFVALTREFVGRAVLSTPFLDPMPSDPATAAPQVSGVLLGQTDDWMQAVPLHVAVQAIDPDGSNPYVQANAAGFPAGVMQITAREYHAVVQASGTGSA